MLGSVHRNFWEGVHGPLGSEDMYVNTHMPRGERMKGVCPRKRKGFKVIEIGQVYIPVGLLNVEITWASQFNKNF